MSEDERNWWTRPCGGREVLYLALPLVISTISFTLMHFCDRMFLLWYSTSAMAAAAMAGAVNWTVFSFFLGVAQYANTFVAQYHGARRPERIGLTVWQATRIGLYAMPVFFAIALLCPWIFRFFGHSPNLLWQEVSYFRVLAFGSGAVVMSGGLASFFIGRGETRVIMYTNIVAAVMNLLLDWLWIFGRLGFPEMGIEGGAWATVVAQWFKTAVYFVLIHSPQHARSYAIFEGRRFDWGLMRRMLYFGGPNGLQFVVEGGAFTIFFLLIGRLGETPAAASSVALNVNMVAFVPMIGVGMAVTTLVGRQIGQGNSTLAARATWTATILGLIYTSVFGALYLFAPDLLLAGHRLGSADFESVRDTAVILLRFVAAYCLFDAMQLIFSHAIKGAGDTRFVLYTTLITSVAFVAIGMLGAWLNGWGVFWWWSLITAWLCLLCLVYYARFMQGRWREMSVIEPDVAAEDDQDACAPAAAV